VEDAPIDPATLDPNSEEAMMAALGLPFSGFDSSKGKKIEGADVSGVKLKSNRQYRQYMNRRTGVGKPGEPGGPPA